MDNLNSEPISVDILDREYQFACEAGEREALKAAAAFLDERMRAIKSAGELRLISEPELRTRLADYYVYATSLQAEHLFQYLPRYREYVRGVVPFGIQRYVWDECHVTRTGEQRFVDCAPPIDGREGRQLLDALAGDDEVLRGLRFWISNLIVASLVIDDNLDQIDELLILVDASLGRSKVAGS